MSFPKAILLDLDDTILASTESVERCWKKICEQFSTRLSDISPHQLFAAIQYSSARFWENPKQNAWGRLNAEYARQKIVRHALIGIHREDVNIANEIAQAFSAARRDDVTLFPGAIEALHAMRNWGIHLALLTNGHPETQGPKIEKGDIGHFFDHIFIEGECGVGKPDPQAFKQVLSKLQVQAQDTWMVGNDLVVDIAPAQKLGIYGIWVDSTGAGLPEHSTLNPDKIIKTLSDLVPLLRR